MLVFSVGVVESFLNTFDTMATIQAAPFIPQRPYRARQRLPESKKSQPSPTVPEIYAEDIERLCELGFGSGGTVSKVRHRSTARIMACKVSGTSRNKICIEGIKNIKPSCGTKAYEDDRMIIQIFVR